MVKRIQLREMTEKEQQVLKRLSSSMKAEAALVRRASMVLHYYAGDSCNQIGRLMQMDGETVSKWVHRFVDGD